VEMMVWNVVLTAVVGLMGFLLKSKFDELSRLGILLNRTREEVARDHITRKEVDDRVEKLVTHMDQRFNRIEQKLDDMRKAN
jgi:ABC-type Fe3+-hydroxamate transport system substrate-binding protein